MAESTGSGESVLGAAFTFRVSDALMVPLRGYLLRLHLAEGRPRVGDLRPGTRLLLSGPDGERRVAQIKDLSITGGRTTQERLDTTRELDIVISEADAVRHQRRVTFGWTVSGPIARGEEETG